MISRNVRIIDPGMIEHNMRQIRAFVPQHVKIMAVVKADGYGHGAFQTAKASLRGGADMLAVASVSEGKQLREEGITVPVLVLGAVMESDVQEGVDQGLILTVCSPDMVELCQRASVSSGKQTEVHLKIDTGMGRIGVRTPEERDRIVEEILRCDHIRLTGVFTHFADADGGEEGIRYTQAQFRRFKDMIAPLPDCLLKHCCNSAAIHRFPEMSLDMVRAGISLYGYPPVPNALDLRPCMTWKAMVSHVKELPPGEYVSYGRTYRNSRQAKVATITCGYGDGYHRAAGTDGYVLIHGKRAKIIGRICMDQLMADVTGIDRVSAGDEAVLIGKDGHETITAEDIARWADTISYEILLSAGNRVERVFR